MLLAPARKRNVQCDARRQHRRCRYENRTSARPVGSSRIRLHGVAGARKRGAMSLPGNHVGSRQCAIRPESRGKQTCQGYRSTDANDPNRSAQLAGRRSPYSPSISHLTSRPETILDRRSRGAKFQAPAVPVTSPAIEFVQWVFGQLSKESRVL